MPSDIFALLRDDAAGRPARADLPVVSPWRAGVQHLMFFTLIPEKFASHFEVEGKFRYLCPGDGCPACAVGERPFEDVYLPVWDVRRRRVAILQFDARPDGAAGKILAFLQAHRDRLSEVVAVFHCRGKGEFDIVAHAPRPETDRGAVACAEFCERLDAGAVDLRDCVRRLGADEIAALPSVRQWALPPLGAPAGPAIPDATAGPDACGPDGEGAVA